MQKTQNKPAKKNAAVKSIPEGYHTITPGIIVKDAVKAIEHLKKALGATELFQMACSESGKVMHAELKVGNSVFSICEEMPGMCAATSSSFYLYVNDCDASYKKALDAGMTTKMPIADMFWGDRVGKVADSYGNTWAFATHQHDYTPEQITAGQKKFAAEMKSKMGAGACSSSSSKKSCS